MVDRTWKWNLANAMLRASLTSLLRTTSLIGKDQDKEHATKMSHSKCYALPNTSRQPSREVMVFSSKGVEVARSRSGLELPRAPICNNKDSQIAHYGETGNLEWPVECDNLLNTMIGGAQAYSPYVNTYGNQMIFMLYIVEEVLKKDTTLRKQDATRPERCSV